MSQSTLSGETAHPTAYLHLSELLAVFMHLDCWLRGWYTVELAVSSESVTKGALTQEPCCEFDRMYRCLLYIDTLTGLGHTLSFMAIPFEIPKGAEWKKKCQPPTHFFSLTPYIFLFFYVPPSLFSIPLSRISNGIALIHNVPVWKKGQLIFTGGICSMKNIGGKEGEWNLHWTVLY